MSNIGRLVRTTNEDCKECDGKMQLRAFNEVVLIKGEETSEENFHLVCNKCEYEEEYKDKKQNKNKHREIKEVVEVKTFRNRDKNKRNKSFGR